MLEIINFRSTPSPSFPSNSLSTSSTTSVSASSASACASAAAPRGCSSWSSGGASSSRCCRRGEEDQEIRAIELTVKLRSSGGAKGLVFIMTNILNRCWFFSKRIQKSVFCSVFTCFYIVCFCCLGLRIKLSRLIRFGRFLEDVLIRLDSVELL